MNRVLVSEIRLLNTTSPIKNSAMTGPHASGTGLSDMPVEIKLEIFDLLDRASFLAVSRTASSMYDVVSRQLHVWSLTHNVLSFLLKHPSTPPSGRDVGDDSKKTEAGQNILRKHGFALREISLKGFHFGGRAKEYECQDSQRNPSACVFSSIESVFKSCPKLTALNLSDNELCAFDLRPSLGRENNRWDLVDFGLLTHLRRLDLSANELGPSFFEAALKQQVLNLEEFKCAHAPRNGICGLELNATHDELLAAFLDSQSQLRDLDLGIMGCRENRLMDSYSVASIKLFMAAGHPSLETLQLNFADRETQLVADDCRWGRFSQLKKATIVFDRMPERTIAFLLKS